MMPLARALLVGVGVAAALASCASRGELTGRGDGDEASAAYRAELAAAQGSAPGEACSALQRAADSGHRALAPLLLDFLTNDDGGVRACAHHAAVRLLGSDPVGYQPYLPALERERLVARWRELLDTPAAASEPIESGVGKP